MIINGYGNDEMCDNLDWIYYRIDLMRLRNGVYLNFPFDFQCESWYWQTGNELDFSC